MFISIVLFIIGLVLLIFCGDWFVDGATGIARKFHIPELIIGDRKSVGRERVC